MKRKQMVGVIFVVPLIIQSAGNLKVTSHLISEQKEF